jgi:hypothetical protein
LLSLGFVRSVDNVVGRCEEGRNQSIKKRPRSEERRAKDDIRVRSERKREPRRKEMIATMRTNEREKVLLESVVGSLLEGKAVAMLDESRESGYAPRMPSSGPEGAASDDAVSRRAICSGIGKGGGGQYTVLSLSEKQKRKA